MGALRAQFVRGVPRTHGCASRRARAESTQYGKQSGTTTGKVKWSIKDVDENLYHVLLSVTSGTGAWSDVTPDDSVAMTHEISSDGKALYFHWNWYSTTYPASGLGFGPFTKS
jgi:mitochondrial fission protein ELM1